MPALPRHPLSRLRLPRLRLVVGAAAVGVMAATASPGVASAHHKPDHHHGPGSDEHGAPGGSSPAPAPAPSDPRDEEDGQQGGATVTSVAAPDTGRVVGVATVNTRRDMGVSQIRSDRRLVTSRRDVDVIGWQEAERATRQFRQLERRGWSTAQHPGSAGTVAVSWRRSVFSFVDSTVHRLHSAHSGTPATTWRARYAQVVTLEHRRTGERFVLINAHIVPYIEDHARPGHPRSNINAEVARRAIRRIAGLHRRAVGRYVVGTGDYNWDYLADSRVRHPGYVLGRIGRVAVSSYEALGTRGLSPTLGRGRFVDYVFTSRLRRTTRFVSHDTLAGLHTDHRPLVAQVELLR